MMPKFKTMLLAGTIALLPLAAPAHAAPEEAPAAEVVVDASQDSADVDSEAYAAESKAKMEREMDAAIAIVEKMFDTSDLPPVEPARLTLAQTTMGALIPSGSLERMMDNLYGKMFKTIMGEMGGESDLMISIKTGVESEKIAALDEATKGKIADVFDPNRQEREDQINKVIKPLISEVLADMEPPMRAGMAKAYARKFSAAQLTELNAFLATPTGTAYGSDWMALQADPEVMLAVIKAMPPLISKFIDRAPQIEKDMKELPKEKQLADLSDAELSKLAKLMKVDVKTLKEQRDMWKTDTMEATDAVAADDYAVDAAADAAADDYAVDAASDAATAAAAAADAAVEDPAYDRSNWSAADLKRVEDLETAYENASIAVQQAADEAVENARKKKK
ncbi:DUF2059 domain-containing protein [Sphingopyxis macrogoltabida]|uniref:DUF2059 domain-containing protein n=1 Tax=Sphingopyxis macrogoltabida TaxID=33050 RepID=A0AAC8YXX6_SPHMC|nr:DUF2059 domain-containing protein [Sphingopyxis macrogoltabida]ALJ12142.1 hypothetical protein LH19_04610 [Sphingopyxis macrogoltabida]AMU88318.1 hypothetical protein ATM17_04575 [Sphingopyxis macrogoltabida]